MRLKRLIARKKRGVFVVQADVSGQGKRSVRATIGYLDEPQKIAARVENIRAAATLRDALSQSGGM